MLYWYFWRYFFYILKEYWSVIFFPVMTLSEFAIRVMLTAQNELENIPFSSRKIWKRIDVNSFLTSSLLYRSNEFDAKAFPSPPILMRNFGKHFIAITLKWAFGSRFSWSCLSLINRLTWFYLYLSSLKPWALTSWADSKLEKRKDFNIEHKYSSTRRNET